MSDSNNYLSMLCDLAKSILKLVKSQKNCEYFRDSNVAKIQYLIVGICGN